MLTVFLFIFYVLFVSICHLFWLSNNSRSTWSNKLEELFDYFDSFFTDKFPNGLKNVGGIILFCILSSMLPLLIPIVLIGVANKIYEFLFIE
jgi:hypothetical protein